MTKRQPYPSFWRKLYTRLNNKRIFRYAKRWFYLLLFLAVFGGYIANDIPLYCQYNGQVQFPIFQKTLSSFGYSTPFNEMTNWDDEAFTAKVYPIIPYSARAIDLANSGFKSPFGKQQIKSYRYRHWLGTDQIGRDVLSGMISGARISILVSLIGMGIATIIGLFLGSMSGFYGNRRLKFSFGQMAFLSIGLLLFSWLFYALPIYFSENGIAQYRAIVGLGLLVLFILLWKVVQLNPLGKQNIFIPIDSMTIFSLEAFGAIPKLLLVLVIGALFPPSLFVIAFIIGITHWPSITRFTRSEMLKIKEKEYILSAQMQQIPQYLILFRYALPNAIGPALIVIMLGIGEAIMVEAFLSFLGFGLPGDVVSWGQFLAASRLHFSAWWLAVFPGLAIFLTIYAANKMGELLMEEMGQK